MILEIKERELRSQNQLTKNNSRSNSKSVKIIIDKNFIQTRIIQIVFRLDIDVIYTLKMVIHHCTVIIL